MLSAPLLDILRCPAHSREGVLARAGRTPAGPEGLRCQVCGTVYPVLHGVPDLAVRPLARGSFLEIEAQQWDGQAAAYDSARSRDRIYRAAVDAAVRSLRPVRGERILDAGCGTGLTVRQYAQTGARIVAFDLSLQSLLYLRRALAGRGLVIDFVRGHLDALPFAEGAFDKVLCANTLQHVPTEAVRRECVRHLARVARPGARIVVTAHNFSRSKKRAGWAKERRRADGPSGPVQYIYRFEREEFRDLLASSLRVRGVRGAGLPLVYGYKLSPVSLRLERIFRRFKTSARFGHMLLGVCDKEASDGLSRLSRVSGRMVRWSRRGLSRRETNHA